MWLMVVVWILGLEVGLGEGEGKGVLSRGSLWGLSLEALWYCWKSRCFKGQKL